QALSIVEKRRPPVAIIDLGLPPDPGGVSEGFATLAEMLKIAPEMKVIVATGNGSRPNALRAIAAGAHDFYEKPVEIEVLRLIVDRGFRLHALEAENRRLSDSAGASAIKRIVTAAEPMLRVCRDIEKLAPTNVPVLLLGESGTGKEALARALHELGPRAAKPFVAINCGAIPETLLESELFGYERGAFTGAAKQTIGRIESAQHGTLFLDEIGDLPHALQVKLLRFLQEQTIERIGGRQPITVDVRVVSATNQPLEQQMEAGRFRSDLFYRLNPVTVRVPPLRDRGTDAVLLARLFLSRFNREIGRNLRGFSEAALAALAGHDWPGNVRELENRVKRAVIMADGRVIEAADLELAGGAPPDLDLRAARHRAERQVIERALAQSRGTVAGAARLLGISRPTLYGLIEMHGLASITDPVTAEPAQNGGSS
ncbi:MAG TPA: PEP-CTERM-box response regulator transcription factor, partial [Acetobacteraceae bacterium]|nr:PEP-CTERM-box response regulator transcription factor [Acetobacteraceae bacterium]